MDEMAGDQYQLRPNNSHLNADQASPGVFGLVLMIKMQVAELRDCQSYHCRLHDGRHRKVSNHQSTGTSDMLGRYGDAFADALGGDR